MATWNKVLFKRAGEAYQEVDDYGNVVRYVGLDGVTLFVSPPVGDSCSVVDDAATPTAEMLAVGTAREDAALAERLAIKNAREAKLRALLIETITELTGLLDTNKLMTEELEMRFQDLMRLSEF